MTSNSNIHHDPNGKGSTGAVGLEAQQISLALNDDHNLTNSLIKEIASIANLKRAFKSVKRNKGAPGIDRVSIAEINSNLETVLVDISCKLLSGKYKPSAVRAVEIPKKNGTRQLGIPTIADRIVTQAISQALNPILCARHGIEFGGESPL